MGSKQLDKPKDHLHSQVRYKHGEKKKSPTGLLLARSGASTRSLCPSWPRVVDLGIKRFTGASQVFG
ncbi:hypothetical protein CABS01_03724 [Colletotrichum abscissum]|uniref:uncharacterized protein n=1 Tax=Colletotrichum abscissum TaxID=1671311 RepID=UPI0027D6DB87|nr:uncharacterized protein CABS01_03724 [Colletotrichum abscissum]KAI3529818.1 hypothetical protein CSPX01_15276 [Colletotrichum filicis]KAK1475447.1 hypothetical protein CABS01_03724 [Colletotrichum abscissum]